MSYKLNILETPVEVAKSFAEDFKETVEKNIKEKGECNISLSGGSTPKLLFDVLGKDYSDKIDWTKVNFFWGDERCVPPNDEQSNYGMTKKHFLNFINIPEENVNRVKGEDNPELEAARYSELIKIKTKINIDIGINKFPVFDLMILGMGDDGHTASIFPDNIELWNSKNICEAAEHPVSKQKRITVTGGVINNSKKIVFLITGKNKADVLKKIINKEDDYLKYPASHVSPVNGDLYFYIDKNAAINL